MTRTTRLRRMILQWRQMHLTEARTFMMLLRKNFYLFGAEDDTAFGEVVGSQLHCHFVSG